MRENRALVQAVAVAVLLAGCGGGKKSTSTATFASVTSTASGPSAFRSVASVAQCLAGERLKVLRSGPDGTSILWNAQAGDTTVFRIPKYAASIWVYPSHKAQDPIFQTSATSLKELGYGNVIAVYAGQGQPTHAIEQAVDSCAFGPYIAKAYQGPLIEVS